MKHILLAPLFVLSISTFCGQDTEKTKSASQNDSSPKPSVERIRVDAKVMDKQLKHKVTAHYPRDAMDQRIQGTVRMHVVVGPDGKVKQVDVVSGHPVLAKAAVEAVRQREYKPVLLNGMPVEVDTTVDTVFSLNQ